MVLATTGAEAAAKALFGRGPGRAAAAVLGGFRRDNRPETIGLFKTDCGFISGKTGERIDEAAGEFLACESSSASSNCVTSSTSDGDWVYVVLANEDLSLRAGEGKDKTGDVLVEIVCN